MLASSGDDDDEDDGGNAAAALPRLRFEITFHRPCGSQRRRQRRHVAVEQEAVPLDAGPRRAATEPGETIELDILSQCAPSAVVTTV